MEKIDPKMAQAVWQRVTQARQPMPQPPQPPQPPQQPQPIPPQPVRPNPPKPNPPQPPKPNPQPPRPIRPVLPPPRPPMPIPPPPPPKPVQPSREELRQWLAEIMALERGYRSVNAGRNTPLLRRMASEEQAHERRLAALYTELYGGRPEVLPGAAAGKRSLTANLRDLYGAEQRAVRQWREAATRYPAQRGLFEAFARDDRRHAEQLRRMMKNR